MKMRESFADQRKRYLSGLSVAALLIASLLAGCGGSDSSPVAASEAMFDAPASCQGTPSVASVSNYPLYSVNARSVDMCAVIAHYNAGYAVVSDTQLDPWNPPDTPATFESLDSVQGVDAATDSLYINAEPAASAVSSTGAPLAAQRFVMARASDDSNAPIECALAGNAEDLETQVDACLAPLRGANAVAATAKFTDPRVVAKDAQVPGFAFPDSNAWTLIGSNKSAIRVRGRKNTRFFDEVTGDVSLNMNVYRLNAATTDDYYLVRAEWSATPSFATCDKTLCFYFNNKHNLAFSLSALRDGKNVDGLIEGSMPQTVVRNKSISQKIGGGLSIGDKGPGASVSSDVTAGYSYTAVNVINRSADGILRFTLSHATSIGVLFGGDLFDEDPTTVGGISMTAWGLFRVPSNGSGVVDDIRVTVNDLSGDFGSYFNPGLINVGGPALFPYENKTPYTITVSPPVFTVKVRDERGELKAVTADDPAPLKLKPGQSTTIEVHAGDATTPTLLGWQLAETPSWLTISAGKGLRYTGNRTITVTANPNAAIGSMDYIRFNTMPAAAAPSTRRGPLEIPVSIVQ